MTNDGKSKKASSKKASHLDLEGKKPKAAKTSQKSSKPQVRLSTNDDIDSKKRQSSISKSRKSSLGADIKDEENLENKPEDAQETKERDSVSESSQPLDPEKSKKQAKVLKKFLENKYKVEFPTVEGNLEKSDDLKQPLTDKEILARNGLDIDFSKEEQLHMLNIYQKLEEGIEQAEEFFRSIGIEWNSEEQMFRVKPKKFMPAMTMIAFGPGYDDVIVCKDDEDTGETQACILSKENKDCPEDVTAINLNVYKDGFQAEDDEFNAYTSDSIRDFFLKNIGSYVIMKPNDETPQTVLIRIVDERERSFEEVRREKAQGIPKQSVKPKKKKSKIKDRPKKPSNATGIPQMQSEEETETVSKPKYYAQTNSKTTSMSETVEIFEKHKIIKRFEDMPIEQDGIGSSSWYWRNQRNPLSSEYVVPPNITTTTFETDGTMERPPDLKYGHNENQMPTPYTVDHPVEEVPVKTKKEKSTSITDSLLNINRKRSTIPTTEPPIVNQMTTRAHVPPAAAEIVPQVDHEPRQISETKINKINIYHGPVTVINLGETSDDSVRISPRPDNKFKVSLRRDGKKRGQTRSEDSHSISSQQINISPVETKSQRKTEERNYVDPWDSTEETCQVPFFGGQDALFEEGTNMYETEYDLAYNQSSAKWSEFFAEGGRKRSDAGANKDIDLENANFQHISVLGKSPPPGPETFKNAKRPEKKLSVLLDLGGQTGKRESIQGVELNKKTSEAQITVALRDNNNGMKYLVNIYPEEQLKKIWSILRLNKIDIQNVTPELVLGDSKPPGMGSENPSHLTMMTNQTTRNEIKEVNQTSSILPPLEHKGDQLDKKGDDLSKHGISADTIGKKDNASLASKKSDNSAKNKDNVSEESKKSYGSVGTVEAKPPSIQSDGS